MLRDFSLGLEQSEDDGIGSFLHHSTDTKWEMHAYCVSFTLLMRGTEARGIRACHQAVSFCTLNSFLG